MRVNMTPDTLVQYLHPEAVAAQQKLHEAEAAFAATIKAIRAKCPHKFLVENEYDTECGYYKEPYRICLQCGLEVRSENGSFGVLGCAEYHQRPADLQRIIFKVPWSELFSYRID